jgi:hypothetical protein
MPEGQAMISEDVKVQRRPGCLYPFGLMASLGNFQGGWFASRFLFAITTNRKTCFSFTNFTQSSRYITGTCVLPAWFFVGERQYRYSE